MRRVDDSLLTFPVMPKQIAMETGLTLDRVQYAMLALEAQGRVSVYASALAPDRSTVTTSWRLHVPNAVREHLRGMQRLDGNRAACRAARRHKGER